MSFNEWKEYNLDELYEFSSGLSKSRKEFGFGYPFVTFKDVFYNFFIPSELIELANTTEKERERCSVKRGDVFLTRTSETMDELGKSSVALKDYESATFNGFTKRLRPKGNIEIYPEYAGYYFRSPRFRAEINSMATMTTRASLNNEMMARLKIVVPNIKEQKAIAKILSDLDEKIEVNNKINDNLEKMAQAIFKQWFVDFEFPNENGEQYKSSGGEMIESELGEIPKGWSIKKLDDVLDTIEAGNRPKGGAANITEGIPSIGAENIIGLGKYDYSKEKFVSEEYFNNMKKGIVKSKDVLLYKDGAQLGRKTMFMDGFPHEECCINSHVFILRSNDIISQSYLYFWLDQEYMTQNIINLNANSAQPGINQTQVRSLSILIPSKEVICKFDEVIDSLLHRLFSNCKENNKIINLRDTLLPKLMSGEIRLPLEEN